MWVYRKITYDKARVRYEVGYIAAREGQEYGNGAFFHAVKSFYETKEFPNAEDLARREVHYLNGGTF